MAGHTGGKEPDAASPGRLFVRSLIFAAGVAVSAVIYAPVALLAIPLPFPLRYRIVGLWASFNVWWLGKTCRLHYRVEGREHIPATPTIVLCKHESAWETLVLQQVFSPLVWVLKRELLWIPFFGWGLAVLKPIAINRKAVRRAIEEIVEQGRKRLQDGCWVVIFPEGTRVAPGTKKRYLPGGAALAQRTGYPVVPVAHNAGDFWPRRSFTKRPGTVRLVIGPVIDSRGRSAAQINQRVEHWIESNVARLRSESPVHAAEQAREPAQ